LRKQQQAGDNEFIKMLTKLTGVILDNAAQPTSYAFKNCQREWEKRGLFIIYLLPYSPELNLIEILWRFIKYTWLPFSAYQSFTTLKKSLDSVLAGIEEKYQINFA
jgi:transposase